MPYPPGRLLLFGAGRRSKIKNEIKSNFPSIHAKNGILVDPPHKLKEATDDDGLSGSNDDMYNSL